jgi:hypothetical protein
MAFLRTKPAPFQPGMRYFNTADLNRILEAVHRQVSGGKGINVDVFGDRVLVNASDQGNAFQPELALFVVLKEFDDFLECCPINTGIDDGGSGQEISIPNYPPVYDPTFCATVPAEQRIYVAKPWSLQRSVFDGVIVGGKHYLFSGLNSTGTWPLVMDHAPGERTAGGLAEKITPAYLAGEPIFGLLSPLCYADPNDKEFADEDNRDQQNLVWQDVNCAGRQWLPPVISGSRIKTIYAAGNPITSSVGGTGSVAIPGTNLSFTLANDSPVTIRFYVQSQARPIEAAYAAGAAGSAAGFYLKVDATFINEKGVTGLDVEAAFGVTPRDIQYYMYGTPAWEIYFANMVAGSHTVELWMDYGGVNLVFAAKIVVQADSSVVS